MKQRDIREEEILEESKAYHIKLTEVFVYLSRKPCNLTDANIFLIKNWAIFHMSISVDESINKENTKPTQKSGRQPPFPINPIILNRWSPRSMKGEELDDDTVMSLFEAARWAPSSYNNQPWRFVYAKRNTPYWNRFFDLLAEPNKVWAKDATLLVVVAASKTFEYNGKFSITHQYDAGAAWENLALEASTRGLVAHGIQGFDYVKARLDLEIPDSFDVMAMIVMGKRGPKENLQMSLQEKRGQMAETIGGNSYGRSL